MDELPDYTVNALKAKIADGGTIFGRARCELWEEKCGCGIGKEFACRGMAFCSHRLIVEDICVKILQASSQGRFSFKTQVQDKRS